MCPWSTRISRFLIARVWPNPLQSLAIYCNLTASRTQNGQRAKFPTFSRRLFSQSIVAALLKSAEALTPFLNFAVGCHAVGFPQNFYIQ